MVAVIDPFARAQTPLKLFPMLHPTDRVAAIPVKYPRQGFGGLNVRVASAAEGAHGRSLGGPPGIEPNTRSIRHGQHGDNHARHVWRNVQQSIVIRDILWRERVRCDRNA